MTTIQRVRVGWSGLAGLPGVSTFFTTDASVMLPELWEFFNSIKALLPDGLAIQFPVEGDTIDVFTGLLTGSWTAAQEAQVDGQDTGGYAAPVGAVINWMTGSVVNDHRLRGKTFIVPLASSQFDAGGTILDTALPYLRDNAASLITTITPAFVIWSRPKGNVPGAMAAVTSSYVPDKAAILRSRRD